MKTTKLTQLNTLDYDTDVDTVLFLPFQYAGPGWCLH